MTRVLTTAEQADVTAEPDRVTWDLPRQPMRARLHAVPGSPTPAAQDGPTTGSSRAIGAARVIDSLDADATVLHRLEWQGFLSRYFPGRRRHDLEALTAYGAYRSSRDGDEPSAGEVTQLDESEPLSPESRAADSWEDDGGATR